MNKLIRQTEYTILRVIKLINQLKTFFSVSFLFFSIFWHTISLFEYVCILIYIYIDSQLGLLMLLLLQLHVIQFSSGSFYRYPLLSACVVIDKRNSISIGSAVFLSLLRPHHQINPVSPSSGLPSQFLWFLLCTYTAHTHFASIAISSGKMLWP